MTLEDFENEVRQVLEELPMEFRREVDNVEVLVEVWPTEEQMSSVLAHPGSILFGLYQGIPKTKRLSNYSGVLPDKITIFAGPIISLSKDLHDAKKQIKKTVLHEIGHYFGMSEDSIRNAQADW